MRKTGLSLLAAMFLTWRFMVTGMWIGLSGNRKLIVVSALPYSLAPVWLIAILMLIRPDSSIRVWIRQDPNGRISSLIWIAALAVIAKFGIAVFSGRKIAPQRLRQYAMLWLGGTVCLIALAILLWSGIRHVVPVDAYRLRNILILAAVIALGSERHGKDFSGQDAKSTATVLSASSVSP